MSEPRTLAGWEEIGDYLGVRARSAMRYARPRMLKGIVVRKAMPVVKNFRGMMEITVDAVAAWKAESAALLALATQFTPAEQALVAAPVVSNAPDALPDALPRAA